MRNAPHRIWPWAAAMAALAVYAAQAAWAAPLGYLIELERPPAVKVWSETHAKSGGAAAAKSARDAIAAIKADQAETLAAMAAKSVDATPLYQVQRVYNGVAVRASDPGALRKLPGVKGVHPLRAMQPMTADALPFLGVDAAWGALEPALTGAGVRIGVMDTGIDYLHPAFGGSGAQADYDRLDTTSLDDGLFPTAKVVGGFDFAGDDYDPETPGQDIPQPDPDPMDQYANSGHGTHVASIVAGLGVTASGATYAGPYGGATDWADFAVGPGVAPGASLYALKIFGRRGPSLLYLEALDWAVDPEGTGDFSQRLDVLNLSIGDPYGPADSPEAEATDNAALTGMVIVASAGNSGDRHFSTGAPGSAVYPRRKR